MDFVELTEAEFEQARFSCDNFLQDVRMYRRHRAMGRDTFLVGVRNAAGKVVAKGIIMTQKWYLGKKLCRVPGGWVMDYEAENWREVLDFLTAEAKEFCAKQGGIVLEIAPNIVSEERDGENKVIEGGVSHLAVKDELVKLGYKYLGEYECTKWTYALDVETKTAEELKRNFRKGHKAVINRALREGMRVRELGDGELGILDEIVAATAERHGFQNSGMEYYRTMKEHFGEKVINVVAEMPRSVLEGKEKGGAEEWVPLAASMFVDSGEELVYLSSGSRPEYQKYGAPHLIQWEMIQRAVKGKYKRYNFYGMKPVSGSGVYGFKRGFRGYVREMLGMFALPIGFLGKIYVARLKEITYACIKGEEE